MPSGIKEVIEQKHNLESADKRKEYAVLLGRRVVETMVAELGEDKAKEFLAAHAAFDRALEKNKDIDVFEMIPVHKIAAFNDFRQYVEMLRALNSKVKHLKDASVKPVQDALANLIKLGAADQKVEASAVPADNSKTVFPDNCFRGITLPAVPLSMQDRERLPYSYPNFDQVKNVVVSRFNKSYFRPRLYADLNACAKKSLTALSLHRKYSEGVESDPREYLAEAQQYLMDHNFVGYGLDKKKLATASDRLACAGIPSVVDYYEGALIIASAQTQAYAFLGTNLEVVLRQAIFALSTDVLANYSFEGKQTATDVVIAACSAVVQEAATAWLESLQEAFNKAAEDAAS